MNKYIKVIILTYVVILGLYDNTAAQKDTTKFDVTGIYLSFPLEFPEIEKKSLDNRLDSFGFPSAKYPTVNFGIGISHQHFAVINFRIGYLLPFERMRWEINNSNISLTNPPGTRHTYYFIFTFGIGIWDTADGIQKF